MAGIYKSVLKKSITGKSVIKRIIFLLFLCGAFRIYGESSNIVCFIPKELKTNKKAKMIYEDTEKHLNEEIPDNINLGIVKTLLEKRVVVFQMRCKYENEMYNYIMASDYAIDYLTKGNFKGESGGDMLLPLPTNKAFVFQDMLFIGDLMDNSVGLTDELLLTFYQINVYYLEEVK
ncbi:MAG: DNA methyltransferase, partial [Leptotrichiaceae bacterium]|nr:DNA methyltransferase [Leptotrichiaceae bacterium]